MWAFEICRKLYRNPCWLAWDLFWLHCFQHGPVLSFILMGSFLQDVMQQATNAILRGGTIQAPTVSAKTIAEQLAEKINAKLNYVPIEKQEEAYSFLWLLV